MVELTLDRRRALVLDRLRTERETNRPIGSVSLDDAYAIQERAIAALTDSGERHAGWKVGCTSRAIQSAFGLSQPIRGHLMAPHVHRSGATLDFADYVGCAVEPEIALCIGRSLRGADVGVDELRNAIDGVAPAIEVHNYHFFADRPTSQELIASNGLHAALVVGSPLQLTDDIDLDLQGIGCFVNGELAASGIGAEVMGGILRSLAWLVADLARHGTQLEPGEWVIPGSPVNLVPVAAGDVVETRVTSLGVCRVRFSGGA